jgi:hypothetical protein
MERFENNVTAHFFHQVLDRAQTEMPKWYLPSAQKVLIAAPDILSTSGHRPGAFHAAGWSRGASGFKKASRDGKSVLWVQPCGKFWIIERSIHLDAVYMQDEALVSAFGAPRRAVPVSRVPHCQSDPRITKLPKHQKLGSACENCGKLKPVAPPNSALSGVIAARLQQSRCWRLPSSCCRDGRVRVDRCEGSRVNPWRLQRTSSRILP